MSQQSIEKHQFHVRPRFEVNTDLSTEEVAIRIKTAMAAEHAPVRGRTRKDYAMLWIPHEEQHYWSPFLTLNLEPTENGSQLRGMYSPRPSVWTMFVFFYAVIAFAIMVVGIIGLSQWSLEQPAGILWLVPLLVLLFLSLYLVAFLGQKTSQEQMRILHRFVEESTGLEIDPKQDLMIELET